jgi:hypothetical protein
MIEDTSWATTLYNYIIKQSWATEDRVKLYQGQIFSSMIKYSNHTTRHKVS